MKNNVRRKTIKRIFAEGFEAIRAEPFMCVAGQFKPFECYIQDFLPGGRFERFYNYTIERFENEFSVILWLC